MDYDLNSLGELLRKERSSPYLQEVDKDFYKDLKRVIIELEEKYPPFTRERENLKKLVDGIYYNREKKIVLSAISFSRTDEELYLDNSTKEEEEFLRDLVSLLKERRDDLLGGGKEAAKPLKKKGEAVKKVPEKKAEKETQRDERMVLRILEELPPIVGIDGKTYGPFQPEDIVALPERNARIFLKHGYGEAIQNDI